MAKGHITIKSKQYFEENVDSMEESHECWIEDNVDGFQITYGNTILLVEESRVIITKESVVLHIEHQKKHCTKYTTPYGVWNMEVEGKKIVIQKEPIQILLRYSVKMENAQEYINELQIEVVKE